jgi:hypothetical protein
MAMSGFMFWICFVAFVVMVIKRKRNKQRGIYEL